MSGKDTENEEGRAEESWKALKRKTKKPAGEVEKKFQILLLDFQQ